MDGNPPKPATGIASTFDIFKVVPVDPSGNDTVTPASGNDTDTGSLLGGTVSDTSLVPLIILFFPLSGFQFQRNPL